MHPRTIISESLEFGAILILAVFSDINSEPHKARDGRRLSAQRIRKQKKRGKKKNNACIKQSALPASVQSKTSTKHGFLRNIHVRCY